MLGEEFLVQERRSRHRSKTVGDVRGGVFGLGSTILATKYSKYGYGEGVFGPRAVIQASLKNRWRCFSSQSSVQADNEHPQLQNPLLHDEWNRTKIVQVTRTKIVQVTARLAYLP
jgi:hypothetical protein